MSKRNHEVTTNQLLLDKNGELREPGWSRTMVQEYHRKMIKAPKWRIKEWDYYLVMNEKFAVAFTISDDGYIGLQSASLLRFGRDTWEHTETVLNPFPMGKMKLPRKSDSGVTEYSDKRLWMNFTVADGKRHILCKFDKFCDGKTLTADVLLEDPPLESMIIATPWPKKHAFYYNQKINCMRASGYVEFDGVRHEFNPQTDFGTLDWGRGVWTYDNTWYWGNGNTVIDDNVFGWNIGYGFGDTSAATENVLFYNGRVQKLDDITFDIPEDDIMKTWTITSSDGRFEMEFEPIYDRAANLDFKAIVSDQHQVFGRMSGIAVLDGNKELQLKNVLCFNEKVHNRY